MSNKMKLVEKLVKAAGGWEKFLYETLKEVCTELSATIVDLGVVDEAREVLTAYEETTKVGGQPIHIPNTKVQPVVEDGSKVVEAHKSTTLKENKPVPVPESPKPKPKPKPKHKPRDMAARVDVDTEVGASQGELPIPAGHILTNREYMTIETQGRLVLGRGSLDGQVRGQGVSGHVSLNGKYRLAFKNANLGTGLIHFAVIQEEKKEEKVVEEKVVEEKKEEHS